MTHKKTYIWQHKNWPDFRWDSSRLIKPLGECRFKQGVLLRRVNELNMDEELIFRSEAIIEESLRTSAIEGEKINTDDVRSSVARRLGLPDTGLTKNTSKNIEGLVDILQDATINFNSQLTLKRLKGWHSALFPSGFSGLHKIITGNLRDDKKGPMRIVSGPVGKEKTVYEAPPAIRLKKEINLYLKWFNDESETTDGIIRAGTAHIWFAAIHPFDDGNGRLARTVCDMALSQDEKMPVRYYSLSSQIMEERTAYYNTLASATCGDGDITNWLAWFIDIVSRAIDRSLAILDSITHKSRFWKKYADIDLNERQKKVINRLLDAVPDGFEGGMTNRKYSGMNHVSRATAQRELADLREKGLLQQNKGGGRSVSYNIVILK